MPTMKKLKRLAIMRFRLVIRLNY